MQSRSSDLDEFFSHEVQSYPPSLSDFGKLHLPSNKSDLLKCLEITDTADRPQIYDCKVLDGAAIVHSLSTSGMVTFDEFADKVFILHIERHLQACRRVDLVWDSNIPHSLKNSTREKRGKGLRRKVSGHVKLPGNWKDFLRDENNKEELFRFLTGKVSQVACPPGKVMYITSGSSVVSITTEVVMGDCNQEEADTRMMVHVLHALNHGCVTVAVRTVDTDVVVILLGTLHHFLAAQPSAKIRVEFGMGKNYREFDINNLSDNLGMDKSHALPVFHALTGCDTTSALKGKGKLSAWQAWQAYSDVTDALIRLADNLFQLIDEESDDFRSIEQFVVILYDRTSVSSSINEIRKDHFCKRKISMERLPPTQNALLQHVKRAIYQTGIWTTSTLTNQPLPSPSDFGWIKESQAWAP